MGGAGELRWRSAARGAGDGSENPGIVGRILRQDPLHWPGKVYAGICRRCFITAHGLRFTPGITYGGDVGFQLRTVVALLLSRTPVTVNPRAVCLCRCRGDSAIGGVLITQGRAAGLKQVYLGAA